jgi:RNA polymerase sigma-70 factor (ECF subfamily)
MTEEVIKELIIEFQNGDLKAFNQLYYYLVPKLRTKLIFEIPSIIDIEDVIQETMIILYKNIHNFRYECSLLTYLVSIAKNVNIKLSRIYYKNEYNNIKIEECQSLILLKSNEIECKIDCFDLYNNLKQLKKIHSDVILYCIIKKHNYKETSIILGIKIGTVKSRLSRAKKEFIKLILK